MTQTPRYDVKAVDPLSLKPVLAHLFNQTLAELWLDSPLKDRVVLGIHNLECTGGIREARYRDLKNRKYDGVHMYGPSGKKAYTISVLDIMKSADIIAQVDMRMSAKHFYRKQIQFQFQKRRQNQKSRANRTRTLNDRDVRPQSSNRRQDMNQQRYSVPTSNMFDHLNW